MKPNENGQMYVFNLVASLHITSTGIDGGDKYGSKDTCAIAKSS